MRPLARIAALAALAALGLGGCGSGSTKTVSVSGGVASASTAAGTRSGAATHTSTTSPTSTATAPAGGGSTQGAGSTRTAPAPAFAEHGAASGATAGTGGGGEGLDAAVAVVKAHGFTPNDTSQYRPQQTLRVLVATRTGSNDGYDQQAFFFLDGRYIGTDTSAPSAGIAVASQSDTEVTLSYRLYRPGDPLCCARGGQDDVRFQLDNGRLVALDPIPPVNSSSAPSRQ